MQPDDVVRIHQMIEAAEASERFIVGRWRGDLDADMMLRFALVRAVEIFGEAASKVSAETRAGAPSIPCRAIVAMRNRLIHAYFDIDHDLLWTAATQEIPSLLSALRELAGDQRGR